MYLIQRIEKRRRCPGTELPRPRQLPKPTMSGGCKTRFCTTSLVVNGRPFTTGQAEQFFQLGRGR